jgi:RNA polymerase sigma factor (sigma-70 family)
MATGQPHDVLEPFRRAALLQDGGGMTDGQLLEYFLRHRDEAAFEALVRRHGPMVLGVCRRVLHHPQDAEDAFQATFLVLVRKAASLGRPELLGNWLYGVAYRTARDARAAAARRRARERQVSPMPEPEAPDASDVWRELRPLLDQELNGLPEKYRVAVVLCDLEGRTRRDVAGQLGIPVGTLSGRLTTARGLLARRLARRGLTLSGGALAAALAPGAASACVPAPLVATTVVAATAGAVSAPATALVEGVLKAMWVKKLKITTAALLAVGLLFGSATVMVQYDWGANAAGAPRILQLDGRGRRVAWSPDGKTLAVVTKVEKTFLGIQYDRKGSAIQLWDAETGQLRQLLAEDAGGGLAFQQVVFSPDGKAIAATVSEEVILPTMRQIRQVVKVWDAKTLALKSTLGGDLQLHCVAFSPDGKLLAAGDTSRKTVQLWDATTGTLQRTLATGPATPWSMAFSPDGKTLLVGGQKGDGSGTVSLWEVQTGQMKSAREREKFVTAVAFSPDGKRVAASDGGDVVQVWGVEDGDAIVSLKGNPRCPRTVAFSADGQLLAVGGPDGKVRLWDVQTGALKETLKGHGAEVYSLAFSPDGATLASTSQDQTVRLWPIKRGAGGHE